MDKYSQEEIEDAALALWNKDIEETPEAIAFQIKKDRKNAALAHQRREDFVNVTMESLDQLLNKRGVYNEENWRTVEWLRKVGKEDNAILEEARRRLRENYKDKAVPLLLKQKQEFPRNGYTTDDLKADRVFKKLFKGGKTKGKAKYGKRRVVGKTKKHIK